MSKQLVTPEPEFMDYVKNKKNETTGTVIAVFSFSKTSLEVREHLKARHKNMIILDDTNFLIVRGDDDKIYYGTPAANWEKVREADE